MGKKLYCGNLSYNVVNSDLDQIFGEFGTVQSAEVIMDRVTGRSKGFAFVEMQSDQEAQAAIAGVNGREHDGRRYIYDPLGDPKLLHEDPAHPEDFDRISQRLMAKDGREYKAFVTRYQWRPQP